MNGSPHNTPTNNVIKDKETVLQRREGNCRVTQLICGEAGFQTGQSGLRAQASTGT